MTEMLNDNNSKLIPMYLEPLPQVQETEELKNTMLESNLSSVDTNLMKKTTLEDLFSQVQTLQAALKGKIEKVNDLERKQMELCRPMDKDDILYRLKQAKKDKMDESEELADAWLNGNGGVEAFLEEFLEVRTVHHVRAAKMERIENS